MERKKVFDLLKTRTVKSFHDKDRPSPYGHHECELFEGGQLEAAESGMKWRNCEKNPGHEHFLSVQDYKNYQLPKAQKVKVRECQTAFLDLTVRLRVNHTSIDRPDDDEFSHSRGPDSRLRTGTGFITDVYPLEIDTPCPCMECGGEVADQLWKFSVRTAHHVVYDTSEAESAKVDFFLDDESCERDGRMESVWGVEVTRSNPKVDVCEMVCVAHDEELVEKVKLARRCLYNTEPTRHGLTGQDFLPLREKGSDPGLIVSHPHGQPKKITMGELRERRKDFPAILYTIPTCPGSSGATVFRCSPNVAGGIVTFLPTSSLHSGSHSKTHSDLEEQVNFGMFR